MGIIIGIDVGISTTKIVGLREGRVLSPIRITAADQVTSLYGAFGTHCFFMFNSFFFSILIILSGLTCF